MPLFFAVAALVMVLDQLSKLWIRGNLPAGSRIEVLPGWMHLQYVQNQGAAWGMLSGQKLFLVGLAAVVVGFILFSARQVVQRGRVPAIGLALILGGAVGNLVDRIAFGYVTDFFDLDTPLQWLRTFPVFNVADSALTLGVVLMALAFLLYKESASATEESPTTVP